MPVNITDVDAFTDPVTAPAGGDARNAASVEAIAQKLANRTRYLRNKMGLGIGLGTGKVLVIPGMRFYPFNGSDTRTWSLFGAGIESIVNSGEASLSLDNIVPEDASITALDALVNPGAARTGADRLKFYVTRETYDFSTPAYTDVGILAAGATFPTDTTTNLQVVPILNAGSGTILPITHDPLSPLKLVAVAGNDGAANADVIHAIRVTITWQ